jgi:hypothetical protein
VAPTKGHQKLRFLKNSLGKNVITFFSIKDRTKIKTDSYNKNENRIKYDITNTTVLKIPTVDAF